MLKILLTIGFLQLVTMVVQLVRTKALALMLGPEMVGAMSVIDKLLAVIAQTLSLSLPFAALRFLPSLWVADKSAFYGLVRRMRALLSILIVAGALIGGAVSVFAPEAWGEELLPYRSIVLVAFTTLPVVALAPFLQSAIAGRMQQYRAMIFALLHAVVVTVAGIVGVWWRGLPGVYILYAVLGLPLIWWGARAAESLEPDDGALSRPDRGLGGPGLPREIWEFSLAMLGLAFLTPYAALAVQYEVLTLHGAEAAGWMQAAVGVSLAVRGVLGSAHSVFLTPQVNREGTPEERMRWTTEFQKTLAFLVGVAVPPLLLAPQLVVKLLYSSAFLPGASLVALFVLVEVLILFSGTYQSLILANNHLAYHVVQSVAAQLLVVGAATQLIPRVGLVGAGFALLCAPASLFVATLVFLNRKHGLRVPDRQFALTGFVLAVLIAAGIAGIAWPELTLATISLKVAVYAVAVGTLALFLTADDRRNLKRLATGFWQTLRPAPSS